MDCGFFGPVKAELAAERKALRSELGKPNKAKKKGPRGKPDTPIRHRQRDKVGATGPDARAEADDAKGEDWEAEMKARRDAVRERAKLLVSERSASERLSSSSGSFADAPVVGLGEPPSAEPSAEPVATASRLKW